MQYRHVHPGSELPPASPVQETRRRISRRSARTGTTSSRISLPFHHHVTSAARGSSNGSGRLNCAIAAPTPARAPHGGGWRRCGHREQRRCQFAGAQIAIERIEC